MFRLLDLSLLNVVCKNVILPFNCTFKKTKTSYTKDLVSVKNLK